MHELPEETGTSYQNSQASSPSVGLVRAGSEDGASDFALTTIEILGRLRLSRDATELDVGPRQQARLLALLLARAGQPTNTTDLIDLLWGDLPPASAVNVIHKYVGTLRHLLEPGLAPRAHGSYLLRRNNGYLFSAGPGTLDLSRFRDLVGQAQASLADDERQIALDRYAEALNLWRGRVAGDLAEGPAARVFAAVNAEFYDTCQAAADLALSLRQPARVLPALRLAASMAPCHEPVHAALVSVLAAAGQPADALSVFRTISARLTDDLGIDPGEALQAAHRRLLHGAVAPVDPSGGRSPVPLMRPAQLPPDLSTFVGRDEELAALRMLCAGDGRQRTSPLIVALDGMSGVGKSTLANHFAHQVAEVFPDGHLYLDLRERESRDALRSLLSSLGVPASGDPETIGARTGTYRSLTAGKRILILLDNVRDAAQVRPLLPNSAESLVLITSRAALVGLAALDGAHLIHVGLPDMASAHALLRRRLEDSPNRGGIGASDTGALTQIIESCGRLPLALAVLGARLSARPALSLAAVAAELRDDARRLAAFPGGRGVDDPRTAFSWSYHQLSERAGRLFRLSSAALEPGITPEAAASLAAESPRAARALLDEIAEAALLDEDKHGRFASHVLVRAYAEELFRAEETGADRAAAAERLLQHYLHSAYLAAASVTSRRAPIPPPAAPAGVVPEQSGRQWLDDNHDVLLAAVRHAVETGNSEVAWPLAVNLQPSLRRAGRFHDWQDVMSIALRSAREAGDRVGEALALCGLAAARHSAGADEEAGALLAAAQRTFTEHALTADLAVVHALRHSIHSRLGRHESALVEADQELGVAQAAGDARAEACALRDRGRSLIRLGALDEARATLTRALAVAGTASGIGEAGIRIGIAECLSGAGRHHAAVEQLRTALMVARASGDRVESFEASIELAGALLAVDDVPGSCMAWRAACDLMHLMQNGGPPGLRDRVYDVGGRLAKVTFR